MSDVFPKMQDGAKIYLCNNIFNTSMAFEPSDNINESIWGSMKKVKLTIDMPTERYL